MTKPINAQSLRLRRLIRDARAAGLEVVQVWEQVDGTVKLVTKVKGSINEPVEETAEVEWDKHLGGKQ